MTKPIMFSVDAEALCRVLIALNGPGHYIRELQATRDNPPFLTGNPIDKLVEQYNAQVEAHQAGATAPAQEAAPMSDEEMIKRIKKADGVGLVRLICIDNEGNEKPTFVARRILAANNGEQA